MRTKISLLIVILMLALPSLAAAQGEVHLATLEVKLWPEFDTPDMLVIYDFTLTDSTPLPARVTFKIPIGVQVLAVASMENGSLLNTAYDGPVSMEKWQELTILVDKATTYHFEYYAPIQKTGSDRQFMFDWAGEYAVDSLTVTVQQPPTATSMTGTPVLESFQDTDGLTYHRLKLQNLKASEPLALQVKYQKNDDVLTASNSAIQPSAPLDQNTTGRISLANYTPYLLVFAGFLLIAGGAGYYFLFSRRESTGDNPRRRKRRAAPTENETPASAVYCSQCGERARPGDRFCRVCGTRIRQGN
ncbi:MAG: zinc ribbon domain-containing protein [Chloroflexi bacterium]|nr:zinc ribbon domain-containing protein [Chloroflexota bacterium]